MKRLQCIKSRSYTDAPPIVKGKVYNVDGVLDYKGEPMFFKGYLYIGVNGVYYELGECNHWRYHSSLFIELASDEELEAYRDKVEELQFKEITALELVYTKVDV